MYLKRLEIKGFKSFPEKITLEFDKGITAVVGPNGSGKSNISDAIRWALGEQSVKNLRGDGKMEDVIFAGTQNRKKLGFAEVSMIMDNSDNALNIDYNEVTATRRLFRSGESEFLINGSICRLKDIHELFMDTGIGKEGYSIIGQGRIDEILNSKSEDRRLLFEEAAGIIKYKSRRIEAERKLEREKQNLIRVNDIICEIENQLEPLEKQAEKTKEYLMLTEQIKLIKVNLFIDEFEKIEKQKENVDENYNNTVIEIENEEKNQIKFEKKQADLKNKINENTNELENIKNQLGDIRSSIEQKKNDIKLILSELDYKNEDIKRLNRDLISNKNEKEQKNEELKILNIKKQALELEKAQKKEKLDKLSNEFELINSNVDLQEEKIESLNSNIIEKMKFNVQLETEIKNADTNLEQFIKNTEKIKSDIKFIKSRINDKTTHLQALNIKLDELNKEENNLKTKAVNLTNSINILKNKLENENIKRENTAKNYNNSISKHNILSELEKDYEGYFTSVKSVLKQKESNNPLFEGICGALGELINVNKKYENAIETALGGAIQNIVTKTEDDAKNAINYLKQSNKGRATFLPLSSVKGKYDNDVSKLKNENGFIGMAKDLISYDIIYENIISSILNNVVVVENLDYAVKINKKYNYIFKIVTLGGDVVNKGGSMTGGSISRKSAAIFSRNREIKELNKIIDDNKKLLDNINNEISELKINLNELEKDEKINNDLINGVLIEKSDILSKIEQTKQNINELNENNNKLIEDKFKFEKSFSENQNSLETKKAEFSKLKKEIDELNKQLISYQSGIESDKEKRNEQNKLLSELRIQISEINFNVSSYEKDFKRIKNEIDSIEIKINDINKNLNNLDVDINTKKDGIENLENLIIEEEQKQSNMNEKYKDTNNLKEKLISESDKLSKEILQNMELISNLKNELSRLKLRKENLDEKKSRICDDMWNEYEITYSFAKGYERLKIPIEKLSEEEKKIKNKIKELGNINPNAVDEFNSLKDRFSFLTKQRNDIIDAEDNLLKIIEQLQNLMENQFKEQFKKINDNFGIVFSEMFGGGTGFLKLSDEKDVLNCGVDIIAQPPGKNVQSMSLLSGGERALTAIALLFAILKMKPSPFCILDEIEAALDDANVRRYANYLKNFSDSTQFIVITHRKGTMEAADTLYGVTMQEQGVSALVSVKFVNEELA